MSFEVSDESVGTVVGA